MLLHFFVFKCEEPDDMIYTPGLALPANHTALLHSAECENIHGSCAPQDDSSSHVRSVVHQDPGANTGCSTHVALGGLFY